jgi:hypothetical protein
MGPPTNLEKGPPTVRTARALAAAHPEIASDDPDDTDPPPPLLPSASAVTADTILTHLDALALAIQSYRRSRERDIPGIVSGRIPGHLPPARPPPFSRSSLFPNRITAPNNPRNRPINTREEREKSALD